MGNDDDIADELSWHVVVIRSDPDDAMYDEDEEDDDGIPSRVHVALARIRRFASLPVMVQSMRPLQGLLLTYKESMRDIYPSGGPEYEGENWDYVDLWDRQMVELVVRCCKVFPAAAAAAATARPYGRAWDLVECYDMVKEFTDVLGHVIEGVDTSYHVFLRSLRLLRALHSRQVGGMLAEKVAGDLLPPELVEMIGEGFYDKGLLSSLGL